jgi:uncharacterized protein (DUF4415 family)
MDFLHSNPQILQLVARRCLFAFGIRTVQSPSAAKVQHCPTEGDAMNVDHHFSISPMRRARPPKRKTRITIYLDDEVLKEFRLLSERSGTGYQTLINAALRSGLNDPAAPVALA